MRKLINFVLISVFSILIYSCGDKKQEPIEISPLSLVLDGELSDYFEIVEGSYKFEPYDNQGYLGYIVQIEVKRTETEFEFGIDSLELLGPSGTRLYFDLTDDKGKPILDFKAYSSKYEEFEKLLTTSKNSTAWLSFYNTYGTDKEKVPVLPVGIVKFKTYSTLKFKTTYYSTKSDEKDKVKPSDETSIKNDESITNTTENWDEILDTYEKFADDYIDYSKKIIELQKKNDNTSVAEATKLLPKAVELNQDAVEFSTKLQNGSENLTPTQLARFTKIQLKFTQAVLELSKH